MFDSNVITLRFSSFFLTPPKDERAADFLEEKQTKRKSCRLTIEKKKIWGVALFFLFFFRSIFFPSFPRSFFYAYESFLLGHIYTHTLQSACKTERERDHDGRRHGERRKREDVLLF